MKTPTITRKLRLSGITVFALLLTTPSAYGEVTVYLRLDGVDGDVTAQDYQGEIQVLEWNWSLGHADDGGSSRTKTSSGAVNVQDLSVTTFNSKATPKLIEGVTFYDRYFG